MSILNDAKNIEEKIIAHRRYIHENAETDFQLPLTSAYVKSKLEEMGYETEVLGKCGIAACISGERSGKTILLRADMDALPIREESELLYKSQNGNMHACGHDLHTAMLLGAAELLKMHEKDICGTVKLMFQPAEETMSGAKLMIEEGILKNPKPDAAMMIHVSSATTFSSGSAIFFGSHPSYSASDWFTVNVKGKGCHGASANKGIDPINVIAHIFLALQTINSREIPPSEAFSLTIGEMHAGDTSNVIPDTSTMSGTIRTFDENIRELALRRINEISKGVASAFGASAEVVFSRACPKVSLDDKLSADVLAYSKSLLGAGKIISLDEVDGADRGLGSEDFAFISKEIPSTCIILAAGALKDGYKYPLHHPLTSFDETALPTGAALYANTALEWLKNN